MIINLLVTPGRDLSGPVAKSRPYFEAKDTFDLSLREACDRVVALQREVTRTKAAYARSLRRLEQVMIHVHLAKYRYNT